MARTAHLDWADTGTPYLPSTCRRAAVQLFGLGQSRLLRFDALIVAGAEAEFLPGGVSDSPFFNDTVRRELLLPTRDNQYAERFYLFRALLEAAPKVMLSYRRMEGDQPITATPWVELLDTFHSLAYSHDLHDPHLDATGQKRGYRAQ